MSFKANTIWVDGFRNILDNDRGHSVVVDEPIEDDGQNAGASPLELAVMSLGGCMSIIFRLIAQKRRLHYTQFTMSTEAEMPKGALTISKLVVNAEVVTDAPEEAAQLVFSKTLQNCPVGVLFERAGVQISTNLTVKRG